MTYQKVVHIGDIVCTRNPTGFFARLIRIGAAILDKPNTVNHVIVVHHRDAAGTLWGIEGRPGGVGYVDINVALQRPYTMTNVYQPKTEEQRFVIAKAAEGLLGTPYDWEGIVQDGMQAIHADVLWKAKSDPVASVWGSKDTAPAHVVCSSFADWIYDHVGLASPGKAFDRHVTPGDWAQFIIEKGWHKK